MSVNLSQVILQSLKRITTISLCALILGCSPAEKVYEEKPLKTLYQTATSKFKEEDFEAAADSFDEVERQYPYSLWAPHAQLMSAYACFKAQKFPRAIATLETFLALHPASPNASYAHYLRALCYYTDILSPERDGENAVLALQGFREITQRYPHTDYARDAELKIDFIQEHLASQEMLTARNYLKRKQFIAALERLSNLVRRYPHSILVPETLYRIVECLIGLGLPGLTYKTFALLQYNFPDNTWTRMAEALVPFENPNTKSGSARTRKES